MKKKTNWRKYGFDFLSIFVAVLSAFALNNWNDQRRDNNSENKILMEISNGLEKDLDDIAENRGGHLAGIAACNFFKKAFVGQKIEEDSIVLYYYQLTRDYISIQNNAGYESLKSKGLELIRNDALRLKIISLYEYNFTALQKFEEEYSEAQFHQSYFLELNQELAPHFQMDSSGNIAGFNSPIRIQPENKNKLLLYLWKIERNRAFILYYYKELEDKIKAVRKVIQSELKKVEG